MRVIKRNGQYQNVEFDKVTKRLEHLAGDLSLDVSVISQHICSTIYDEINTSELDDITANYCASLSVKHPDYDTLASRIVIDNNHKNTTTFIETVEKLYNNKEGNNPLITEELYDVVNFNEEVIETFFDYDRDFLIDYFGFKTLERSYLIRVNNKVVERPQHMWMRVALGIHKNDLFKVRETYDFMSKKYFTHATPTLFNAGTRFGSLSSCYLLGMEDSLEGIFKCLTDSAKISKWAGGIGIHCSNIRPNGSLINGTNGNSTGLMPMLKTFNSVARFINQGGKRLGSIAFYIEPWNADIFQFLEAKKNVGNENERARDLFYGLWIPDLFMERVENDKEWSLMCPIECPGLSDNYGDDFKKLYEKYESEGKYRSKVQAREIWDYIIDAQVETGVPYIGYKDAFNEKSNQKNIGTIKGSNLCVAPETKILTDKGQIPIVELKDKNVNVWNGEEFSPVIVRQTGIQQKLIKVVLSDGSQLECTPYHKFYIQNGEIENKINIDLRNHEKIDIIEAKDLKENMKLLKCNYPVIDDGYEVEYPYESGTQKSNVPINANLNSKLEWFAGLCDTDGSISKDGILYITSNNREFLNDIKLMLQTCGINSKVKCDKLIVNYNDKPQRVVKVVDENRYDDTYCFTEYKRNAGIFGGVFCSNCIEIAEVSDDTNYSNCNLASVSLPSFIENGDFNYEKFEKIVDVIVINLNLIIDNNNYPTPETKETNLKHRPIGIGIQGLADLFAIMKIPFDSYEARRINERISEHLYYYALKSSCNLAMETGSSYDLFKGSPTSMGILQFDLWNYKPKFITKEKWDLLKQDIQDYGLKNSLLIALMPTASTAHILGNNSCFEPFINNIFTRRTLAGEFTIVNKYLLNDLIERDLWDTEMKEEMLFNNGSIQNIKRIPQDLKDLYKTAYELKQKVIIDLAADRAKFVCQSQSMNLFIEKPSYNLLTNIHFYAWKQGLKTGSYYIRSKPAINGQKFTLDVKKEKELKKKYECIEQDDGTEICIMCSS